MAVRAVAPLLADKQVDPAVVCVDDQGRFAIALCGGHQGGANGLAREVAGHLGAEPVVTTASDGCGLPGLDDLPGFRRRGRRGRGDPPVAGRARHRSYRPTPRSPAGRSPPPWRVSNAQAGGRPR